MDGYSEAGAYGNSKIWRQMISDDISRNSVLEEFSVRRFAVSSQVGIGSESDCFFGQLDRIL